MKVASQSLPQRWQAEKLYFDSPSFFKDVLEAIQAARRSVFIELYIFDVYGLGQEVITSLLEAQSRGLDVRVIVDGIGSSSWITTDWLVDFEARGLKARVFHPVPWPFSRFFWPQTFRLSQTFDLWRRVNRRNHKKMFLIDDERAFVGSMNVAEHMVEWRETGAQVQGGEIKKMRHSFELNWRRAFSPSSEMKLKILKLRSSELASDLVLLNHPRSLRRRKMNLWVESVQSAQKRVWITSAYFAPPLRLLAALSQVARRGVDVKVLLPYQPDVRIMYWVHLLILAKLLESGIKVYMYLPQLLHAKSLIVDESCWLGSSNMNQRSFLLDLEVDVKLTHEESMEALKDRFLLDISQSHLVTKDDLKSRSTFEVLFARIVFFLFQRWI